MTLFIYFLLLREEKKNIPRSVNFPPRSNRSTPAAIYRETPSEREFRTDIDLKNEPGRMQRGFFSENVTLFYADYLSDAATRWFTSDLDTVSAYIHIYLYPPAGEIEIFAR